MRSDHTKRMDLPTAICAGTVIALSTLILGGTTRTAYNMFHTQANAQLKVPSKLELVCNPSKNGYQKNPTYNRIIVDGQSHQLRLTVDGVGFTCYQR